MHINATYDSKSTASISLHNLLARSKVAECYILSCSLQIQLSQTILVQTSAAEYRLQTSAKVSTPHVTTSYCLFHIGLE